MSILPNIVQLSISDEEDKFIKEAVNLEIDTASEIIENLENVPYIGNLIKLGKLGIGINDLFFTKRLALFLQESSKVEKTVRERFVAKLSAVDQNKISNFLIHSLDKIEDDRKAIILGYLYKRRMYPGYFNEGEPDDAKENDYMFRICHSIEKVYADNLKYLQEYEQRHSNEGVFADDLYQAGLLQVSFPTAVGEITPYYTLNIFGCTLNEILKEEDWYSKQ